MLRDDVRELRREVAEARQAAQDAWPVLPDSQSSGDPETFRLIEGTVNEASGVTVGATFNIDNVRPLAGGLNPAASTADGVNIEVELAAGNYTDNQTKIRAAYDEDNSRWIDVTDQSGNQSPQTYNVKLQAAKTATATSVSVKWLDDSLTEVGSAFDAYDPHQEFSSGGADDSLGRIALVTDADDGAERWELTHLEGPALYTYGVLASDESSGQATATGYTAKGPAWQRATPTGTIAIMGLDGQKTGDAFIAILDAPDTSPIRYRAIELPDKGLTFNVKVQEAKAYTDGDVSVKWLEDDLSTEVGSAFDAYDPHGQFSTGGLDDVFGRVTMVLDATTQQARWELTHLEGLALTAYGTLAEDEGATSSGKASSSSFNTEGIPWNESAPSGSINVVGLDGETTGDAYVAILSNPDASPPEYRAVKTPADGNTDVLVKINSSESAAGYLEDQLVNSGTLTSGYQRVFFRKTGNDTMYAETKEASGGTEAERIIVGQLKAPSGVAIGTATFVIDNVRPLASGTDPVGGNAATEVTINDAIGGYVNNQEIRAVWDDAENAGSGGWKDATIHRFTRIRGLVNEVSGVAHGASGWAVDGIEMLAGSANPGSTVDGYVAKQAYSNNDEVELIWNDVNVRWEDCTDVTYPSKLALAGGSGLTARSGTTPGSGTVQPKRRNTSTGNLENDGSTETWYNLAATAVAADEYVMGKAVLNSAGAVEYWVDWEECPA